MKYFTQIHILIISVVYLLTLTSCSYKSSHSNYEEKQIGFNSSDTTFNKIGEVRYLKNIYYEPDLVTLSDQSDFILNTLAVYIAKNDSFIFEISVVNYQISRSASRIGKARAESIYQFLINHGVNENRLQYSGESIDTDDIDKLKRCEKRIAIIDYYHP